MRYVAGRRDIAQGGYVLGRHLAPEGEDAVRVPGLEGFIHVAAQVREQRGLLTGRAVPVDEDAGEDIAVPGVRQEGDDGAVEDAEALKPGLPGLALPLVGDGLGGEGADEVHHIVVGAERGEEVDVVADTGVGGGDEGDAGAGGGAEDAPTV